MIRASAKPVADGCLADKVFNEILDEYLTKGRINQDPGIMEQMSDEQYGIIQAIKRSRKRTA